MPRLVRVAVDGTPIWGVVEGDDVFELVGDPFGEARAGARIDSLTQFRLLAPVVPSKIVCVGRNYPAHAAEHGSEVPAEPLLFFKPPSSVIGPDEAIVLPRQSNRVEHECELAVVMGRRCKDVSPADAWEYVLGVTCGNDVTARDLQRSDNQWTRAKGFDTFCPVGPWVLAGVSAADVAQWNVSCRVNGDLRQQGNVGEMAFSPAELIAYTSSIMTLEPGDLILTGTPAGVGPLVDGDLVEVEVEGVGVLANPVTG